MVLVSMSIQDQPHVNQDTRLDNRIIDLRVSYHHVIQLLPNKMASVFYGVVSYS